MIIKRIRSLNVRPYDFHFNFKNDFKILMANCCVIAEKRYADLTEKNLNI